MRKINLKNSDTYVNDNNIINYNILNINDFITELVLSIFEQDLNFKY